MNHRQIPERRSIYLKKRLKITLWSTQLLFLISLAASYSLSALDTGEHDVPYLAGIRFDIWFLATCTILITPIYYHLKHGKLESATLLYAWLLSISAAGMAVLEGGLYSVAIMGFPVIAIFSTLNMNRRQFLPIFAFLFIWVAIMGANHYIGWFRAIEIPLSARIIDSLILLTVSSYVAWLFETEARRSMAELRQKHKRLADSKKIIQHLADTDSLTGLANRTSAKDRYDEILSSLNPDTEDIGFYFIDLDNFKAVNDLFDHQVGDKLLVTIARRLDSIAGNFATICRIGGDEFVLFLKATKPFDYNALASEILDRLSDPHQLLGDNAGITASVGITIISDDKVSFEEAHKHADMAMYKAKQVGKNRYYHYCPALHQEYITGLAVLGELKNALTQDLFDLHYQPKINLETGRVTGTEALLRWSRDNPRNLTPTDFIPIIESTELIHEVGAWVIRQACAACQVWHQKGHEISVAVNVSPLQLMRSSFYDVVLAALSNNNLEPQYLEIEITEHFLIQENAEIKALLSKLKVLGITLAIDDFGTGYSNLSYLTRLAIDTLKLDKSFISQIEHSPDNLAIVTAVIEMSAVLNMQVVAEGIESESDRDLLQRLGCNVGQGFLWSKALPSVDLLEYLGSYAATDPQSDR